MWFWIVFHDFWFQKWFLWNDTKWTKSVHPLNLARCVLAPVCNTSGAALGGVGFQLLGGGFAFGKPGRVWLDPSFLKATWRKVGQMRKYLKSCCWKSHWLGWKEHHDVDICMYIIFFNTSCLSFTGFISSLLVVSCFGPLAIGITPSSIDHGVENWAMAPEKVQLTDGRPSKGLTFCWLNFAFLKIALPNSHWKLYNKAWWFFRRKRSLLYQLFFQVPS